MSSKTPVRATLSGSNVTGLAEYQSGEFVPLSHGGLGAALSIGSAGQVLKVNGAGNAIEFGAVEAIVNIDNATDLESATLAVGDKILLSDGGTEGRVLLSQLDTLFSGTTKTLTNKTLTSPNISGLQITDSSIVFEGATADTAETTLTVADPTTDRTITLPDATGTVVLVATAASLTNKTIDLGNNTVTGSLAEFNTALQGDSFVSLTGSETLTNKTLTSAVLNTGVSGTAVLDEDNMATNSATQLATQQSIKAYVDAQVATKDNSDEITEGSTNLYFTNARADARITNALKDEDNMASDSATHVPSQQSVKAYVDSQVTAQDLDLTSDSGTIDIDLDSESLTVAGGTGIDSSATGTTVTLAIDSTVTTLTGTQTLTNKTLTAPTLTSAVLNTAVSGTAVLDEDNMASNSATQLATQQSIKAYVDAISTTLTIGADSGSNDGVVVGTDTLTFAGGTGLDSTVSDNQISYAIDSTVATLTGSQTLTNKTLTTPIIAEIDSGSTITLDATTDIVLDADGGDVFFKDGGTTIATLSNTSSDFVITTGVQDKDFIIKGDDGGSGITALTIDMSEAGAASFNSNVTVGGNAVITGNLTVNGTTTTLATTNSTIEDRLIELGTGTSGTPGNDMGIVMERGDSANAFIGWDESADKFIVGTGTFTGASTGNLTITTGTLVANVEGALTGNASTATTLASARNIGGVSFDGSANIDLPGVNSSGNQDTSGNAATATALATARTIAGQSFDGTGNITIASTDLSNTAAITLLTASQTLTNKTLTSPVINTGVSGSAILDEDNMASDSATQLATQQSIKAYVDAKVTAEDLDVTTDSGTIAIDLDSETMTIAGGTGIDSSATSNTVTLAIDSTVATLTGTQTLTNKTLTAPVISTITNNSNTLTLPTTADTLVGRATTDTLTNKTITSPSVSGLTLTDSSIVFEGATADAYETTLTVVDPTADRTITFQNGTGTVAFLSDVTGGATPGNFTTITLDNNITFEGDTDDAYETTLTVIDPTADRTVSIPNATGQIVLRDTTDTLTNKTIALGSNTVSGTTAQFNTALTDDSFATLTNSVTLTNKTLTTPVIAEIDATANFTVDAVGDIILDSDDGQVRFADGGSDWGLIKHTNNDVIIENKTSDKDIIFRGEDNSSTVNALTLDFSDAGSATFNNNVAIGGNATVTGNLTVNGTTTTLATTNSVISDRLIELGNGTTGTPGNDMGIVLERGDSDNAFIGWDESADKFIVGTGSFTGASTGNLTITTGTLVANLEGNVTGNVTGNTSGSAATVTSAAQTAITSVGTLTALQVDNINIDGNTISSTAGTDLNITPLTGQQIVLDGTIVIDAGVVTGATSITSTAFVGALTGNASTATALATARTLGGVSFDGSADINLPGVNTSGNQDTSGNAATATALATARTIAGQSFDGTGNITIASTDLSNTSAITLLTATQTLTNKTLTTPTIEEIDGSTITLDSAGDINLDADGADIILKDGGTEFGRFTNDSTDFVIKVATQDKDIKFIGDDGGSAVTALTLDMSDGGTAIFNKDIKLGDSKNIEIGASGDLRLYHDGSNSYVDDVGTGALIVRGSTINLQTDSLNLKNYAGDETYLVGTADGAVEIRYDNSKKFETTSSGVTITGTAVASAFTGDLTGDVTGNADTATTLATARTIAGQSFDGSANITIASTDLSNTSNITLNDATQTLTNKTLTSPTINAFSGTGNGSIAGTLSLTSTSTGDVLNITTTENSSTAGPVINLKRNSASVADADYMGQVKFQGENDADQEITYAKITGKIQDASDGSEDGLLEFANIKAGSQTITARLRSDSLQLLNGTSLSVAGDATITGDLTVNGTTTTVSTTNTVVSDSLLELGNGTSGTPANDAGLVIERGSSDNAFIGFDESDDKFKVGTGSFTGASTGNLTITTGTLVANLEGNVTGNVSGSSGSTTGNAATATALATARNIAGQSFDGSANITIASTDLSDTASIALLTSSQTLTNKTLTSPVLNTGVSGTAVADEDDMSSDSATKLATQQSIKAYVDNQTLSLIDEDNMATDSATRPPSQQSVKAYVDSNVSSVSASSSTTFTNKSIDSDNNTITNIVNADIKSSAAIAMSKLEDLTGSRALVSDGSGDVSVSDITSTELGYLNDLTGNIQTQLDAKQATISSSARLNANLIHDGTISNTEFGYLNGVSSNVQTQLDNKSTKGFAIAMAIAL